ncbi:MAG: Ig-like domain-containing protein, partial [Spirochaetota bacterium]
MQCQKKISRQPMGTVRAWDMARACKTPAGIPGRKLFSLLPLLVAITCNQPEKIGTYFPGINSLKTIEINPLNTVSAVGVARQFSVTGIFSDGSKKDLTSLAEWSTTAPATLESQGVFKGTAAGMGKVQARVDRFSASSDFAITDAQLQSVTLTPVNSYIPTGTAQQYSASASFSDGSTADVTAQASWSSDNTGVAAVSGTGSVSGVSAGATTIRAVYTQNHPTLGSIVRDGSATASVPAALLTSIAISPASVSFSKGTTMQLVATGTYTDGTNTMTQNITSSVVWTTDNASIVSVNSGGVLGQIKAENAGAANITASIGAISSPAMSATVTPAILTSISVTPNAQNIPRGITQQYTAMGTFSDGTLQNITSTVIWTIAGGTFGGGGISNAAPNEGLLTTQATTNTGTYSVQATSGAITGSAPLIVTPANMTGITVTAPQTALARGLGQQYTATASYSDGTTATITTLATWDITTPTGTLPTISNTAGSNGYLATTAATTIQTVTV